MEGFLHTIAVLKTEEALERAAYEQSAHRIGHGTRLIDDVGMDNGSVVRFGDLAQYILDKRIPIEVCLQSNVHTGVVASLAEHPFGTLLFREEFRVTLNTDNRLMSGTSMTKEFKAAAETFTLCLNDFEKITINAMKSAFIGYSERFQLIYDALSPGTPRPGKPSPQKEIKLHFAASLIGGPWRQPRDRDERKEFSEVDCCRCTPLPRAHALGHQAFLILDPWVLTTCAFFKLAIRPSAPRRQPQRASCPRAGFRRAATPRQSAEGGRRRGL